MEKKEEEEEGWKRGMAVSVDFSCGYRRADGSLQAADDCRVGRGRESEESFCIAT